MSAYETLKHTFQRLKNGVKEGFSYGLGYIPRGIVLTSGIFAGSAILEHATGMPLLGISHATDMGLLKEGLFHLGVGSVISGTIGAGIGLLNDERPQSDQLEVPGLAKIITPGKEELAVTKTAMDKVKELATHTGTHIVECATGAPISGLPIGSIIDRASKMMRH